VKVSIKWPNDVMADGRKLAGILVETVAGLPSGRGTILGIGVNLVASPGDLSSAAALHNFSPDVTIDSLKTAIINELDILLSNPELLKKRYSSVLILPASIKSPSGNGKPLNYNSGIVALQTDSGIITVDEAEIIFWEG